MKKAYNRNYINRFCASLSGTILLVILFVSGCGPVQAQYPEIENSLDRKIKNFLEDNLTAGAI